MYGVFFFPTGRLPISTLRPLCFDAWSIRPHVVCHLSFSAVISILIFVIQSPSLVWFLINSLYAYFVPTLQWKDLCQLSSAHFARINLVFCHFCCPGYRHVAKTLDCYCLFISPCILFGIHLLSQFLKSCGIWVGKGEGNGILTCDEESVWDTAICFFFSVSYSRCRVNHMPFTS